MTDHTLDYYNIHAAGFAADTVAVDFSETAERFLKQLPDKGHILDLGCGSGRDTKYFLEKGYAVTAADGSEELCALASVYTGVPVRHMLFQELDAREEYDGIWACSSILHLTREDLKDVLCRIQAALRPGGVLYTSFKYGTFSGMRNGRYFTDLTEDTFREIRQAAGSLQLTEQWISTDVRPGRENEKWLNVFLKKREPADG